jgi:hypothetical protein
MKGIVAVIVYSLSLFLGYFLYKKYGNKLGDYINEIAEEWPDIPNWLNWTLGILLFFGCVAAQSTLLFESILIWLIFLVIIPFFFLPIVNSKVFNFLSVSTLFLTGFFSISLFFNVDNTRDIIGEKFISNYSVYYTTEYVQRGDADFEVDVAHVETGDSNMDFILESIFPHVYRVIIGLIVALSMLMHITLREKNKLIRTGYNNGS